MAYALFGSGGTTIYIRQDGVNLQYSPNQTAWNNFTLPATLSNASPGDGVLTLEFTNNITLNNINNYFRCNSESLQIGSSSLLSDGSRPTITITATNYEGLVQNGAIGVDGFNNVAMYNLIIDGTGGSLADGAGWFGQSYYGRGTSENYIINCSSSGPINNNTGGERGGGILGEKVRNVTLIGCSSSGDILGNLAGGIVGSDADSVVIQSCWSTGAIAGDGAGGIVGANSTGITIVQSYSEGVISASNAGGIIGANPGTTAVEITECYSHGAITGINAGGICGSIVPGSGTSTVSITNCYTTGNLNNTGTNFNGCICGLLGPYGSGAIVLTISHCYTTGTVVLPKGYIIGDIASVNGTGLAPTTYVLSNNYAEAGSVGGTPGTWSTTHANSTLQGVPTGANPVGITWVASVVNQPYELAEMGYSPYAEQNIFENGLITGALRTLQVGQSTPPALRTATYQILYVSGPDPASADFITMDSTTGVIGVPSTTVPGTYTITLRSTGSYNISVCELTVNPASVSSASNASAATCCTRPISLQGADYTQIAMIKAGNSLLGRQNRLITWTPMSYYDLIRIQMAEASKRR